MRKKTIFFEGALVYQSEKDLEEDIITDLARAELLKAEVEANSKINARIHIKSNRSLDLAQAIVKMASSSKTLSYKESEKIVQMARDLINGII